MAVSATVSPGKIFSSDEVITISELNKLGTPTVDISGAVGSLSISTNSINNSHLQSAAAIQLDKLASGTSAQVVVANSTGVPTYVALSGDATISNAGVLALAADSVVTVDITDLNVTTGKLADDAVTAGKLADTAVSAGSYTAADITVDAQGRLTSAASGSSTHPTARITSFTADGTWTAPTGVTRAKFTVVGGGGAGCSGGSLAGGGGGTAVVSAAVTAATAYTITVGAGVSQQNSSNGRIGVDSTVVVGATTYTGGGGLPANSGSSGVGGDGTNGDVNIAGGDGRSSHYGGLGFYGAHGQGSVSTATSSAGIVIVEWVE